MAFFKALGTGITKATWPFALFVPVISLIFIIAGFVLNGEIEDRVSNIWIPEGTQYHDDSQYKENHVGQPAVSVMSAVARPRKSGANVLTAENLLAMKERMVELEQATVEHDDMTFTFDDVCYNLDEYRYPCFRMTPLDCFYEGSYSWDNAARTKFFNSALNTAKRDLRKGFVDRLTAEIHCNKNDVVQVAYGASRYLAKGEMLDTEALIVDQAMYDSSTVGCRSDSNEIISRAEHSLVFWEIRPKQYLGYNGWGDNQTTSTLESVQLPEDAAVCKCCVDDKVATFDDETKEKYYYVWAHAAVGSNEGALKLIPEFVPIHQVVNPQTGETQIIYVKHPERGYYDWNGDLWPQLPLYTHNESTDDYTRHAQDFNLSDVYACGINVACGPAPDQTPLGWDASTAADIYSHETGGDVWEGGNHFSPPLRAFQKVVMDGLVDDLLPNMLKILMSNSEEDYDKDGNTPFDGFDVVNAPSFVNYDDNNKDADINRPKLSTTTLIDPPPTKCTTDESFAIIMANNLGYGFFKNCFQLIKGAEALKNVDLCDPVIVMGIVCQEGLLRTALANPLAQPGDPYYSWTFEQAYGDTNFNCTPEAFKVPPVLDQASIDDAFEEMGVPYLTGESEYQKPLYPPVPGNPSYDLYVTENRTVYNYASYLASLVAQSCPLMCMSDTTGRHGLREKAATRNAGNPFLSKGFEYPPPDCSDTKIEEMGSTTAEMSDEDVLEHASKTCYMFDQGAALPSVQTAISYGGPHPKSFDYMSWALHGIAKPNTNNEFYEGADLTKLEAIQNLFFLIPPAVGSSNIVERVANRPDDFGGAANLTKAQAEAVLSKMKAKLEEIWTKGWDSSEGSMQFNSFTDDNGVGGTFANAMDSTTREMENLGIVSYAATIVVSIWFLYESSSRVRSRVTLATVGVVAAILALGGGIGLYCFFEKLNVAQMWTVPFLLLGIGIDDMYIMSLAAPHLPGDKSADEYFVEAYADVAVPMTMTSLTLVAMFAIMYLIQVPAVYLTAFSACICVAVLWLSNMVSFAAMVLLDLRRQEANRLDVMCCNKSEEEPKKKTTCLGFMYKKLYHPIQSTLVGKLVVSVLAVGLVCISAYGISDIVKGLTIGDFAKSGTQLGAWVDTSQKLFGTWSFKMNWIEDSPDAYITAAVQMKMTKSWEMVAQQDHVLANSSQALLFPTMALWGISAEMSALYNHGNKRGRFSSDYCNKSFTSTGANCSDLLARAPYDPYQPKIDYALTCQSTFHENVESLKLYAEPGDLLYAQQGSFSGICLKGSDIIDFVEGLPDCNKQDDRTKEAAILNANKEYCPVMEFDDDAHFQKCYELMAAFTTLDSVVSPFTYDQLEPASDALKAVYTKHDSKARVRPLIPIMVLSSGSGTNVHLENSAAYIDLIKATRTYCDDKRGAGDPKCFIDGIAYTYWEQYLEIEEWLWSAVGLALMAGWVVSSLFLLFDLFNSKDVQGTCMAKVCSSCFSGFLIAFICAYCTFLTLGLSMLAGVQLSGFSAMSCILSVGFGVEYAVHIVHRFIKSPETEPSARAEYAMGVLFKPTFMAFVSTFIGVVCIGFSGIHFVTMTFFTPLLITCVSTYFGGIFVLPLLLNAVGPCMTAGLDTVALVRRNSLKGIDDEQL